MFAFLSTNPNFRSFWFAQVVSQVGDRIHTLAVIWLVYTWTQSGSVLGAVLIASTLPAILISPWAGSIADRFNRKKIAIACDASRSVLVALLAGLAYLDQLSIPLLIGVTALMSVASAFFNPVALAMTAALVEPEDLGRANAITQLSANASGALGFLLGGGLISVIGVTAAFFCNGCSFLLSAFFILKIAYQSASSATATSFVSDLQAGWSVVKSKPMVLNMLGPLVVINFLFSSLSVLIPIFSDRVFKMGSTGIGLLLGGFTGGMFLAAFYLSTSRIKVNMSRLVTASLLVVGFCFMAMGLFAVFPLFVLTLVLIGFALNGVNICLISMFQRVIPRQVLGKFFSLLTAVSLSAQPVSFGVTGWLSDVVDPMGILLFCGCSLLLCAFIIFRIPELREQYL